MSFTIESIPEKLKDLMITKGVWQESCPVSLEQLRLLRIKHYDFTGKIQVGEIVVHYKMAENTIKIFQELLKIKFSIAKIKTIDHYDGNDDRSMEDNNSCCFNYRTISGSSLLSMHSYGLAIDINPIQNPYLIIGNQKNIIQIYPDEGGEFLNRNNLRPGMIEPVVEIFARHGFCEWGGRWNSPIDYHHFQVKYELIRLL